MEVRKKQRTGARTAVSRFRLAAAFFSHLFFFSANARPRLPRVADFSTRPAFFALRRQVRPVWPGFGDGGKVGQGRQNTESPV